MDIWNILLEIFGYTGTVLVVVAMMMTSVTKLRITSLAGAVINAIYSAVIAAYPVLAMNICLIVINSYHLIRAELKRRAEAQQKPAVNDPAAGINEQSKEENDLERKGSSAKEEKKEE